MRSEHQVQIAELVRSVLSQQPYRFVFPPPDEATATIVADLGDKTFPNEQKSCRPFVADEFIRQSILPLY